jgi:predicted nucleic acid-binding protein
MKIYAESSAVLAWLLGQDRDRSVRQVLARSELVIASDLTLIECDRVLHRAVALGEMREGDAADKRGLLASVAAHWTLVRLQGEVVDRARQAFPAEPLRALDAIHLATALVVRAAVPGMSLLSLDERIRRSARQLGLSVLPG